MPLFFCKFTEFIKYSTFILAQMEKDLIDRHAEELEKLKLEDNPSADAEETEDQTSTTSDANIRKSKAQKRRERKEQEAKRRDNEIQQGEEDNKTSVRQLESKCKIKTILFFCSS